MPIDLNAAKDALETARQRSGQLIKLIEVFERDNLIGNVAITQEQRDAIRAEAVSVRDDFQSAAQAAIQNLTP